MTAGLAGILLSCLSMISWAISNIFQKQAFRDPGVTAAHTVLFSATTNTVCLWALAGLSALWQPFPPLNTTGLLLIIAGGLSATVWGRLLIAVSVVKIGPSRTSTTKVGAPVVSLILAWVLLDEVLNLQTGAGIALVLFGVLLLMTERLSGEDDELAAAVDSSQGALTARAGPRPVDYLAGIASAAMFAIGDNLRKVGLGFLPSASLAAAVGVTGASIWIIASLILKRQLGTLRGLTRRSKLYLTLYGVAASIALLGSFSALMRVEVAVVSTILATEPLATILLSRVLLRRSEQITPRLVVSACLVIAGAAMITIRRM